MRNTLVASTLVLLLLSGCQPELPAPPTQPAAADPGAGFVSVFNGVDLAGWTGALDGYAVENGLLVCLKDGGGNLYIDQPYSDFVLRFDFKLEPVRDSSTPRVISASWATDTAWSFVTCASKHVNRRPHATTRT